MNSMQTCPNCRAEFDPLPERRGHAQVYCSPRCRRAAAKRRAAPQTLVHASRTFHATPSPPPLQPQNDDTPSWVWDMLDDLCRANWQAHVWRLRCLHLKEDGNLIKPRISDI